MFLPQICTVTLGTGPPGSPLSLSGGRAALAFCLSIHKCCIASQNPQDPYFHSLGSGTAILASLPQISATLCQGLSLMAVAFMALPQISGHHHLSVVPSLPTCQLTLFNGSSSQDAQLTGCHRGQTQRYLQTTIVHAGSP